MSPLLTTLSSRAYGLNAFSGPLDAFESIATATGNGSATTLTFDNIPQNYKHLHLRTIARKATGGTGGTGVMNIRFNQDSTNGNYRTAYFQGGSVVQAPGSASRSAIEASWMHNSASPANAHSVGYVDIYDYASSTKKKAVQTVTGSTNTNNQDTIVIAIGVWDNTNAITRIDITNDSSVAFSTTTQVALYGIRG